MYKVEIIFQKKLHCTNEPGSKQTFYYKMYF